MANYTVNMLNQAAWLVYINGLEIPAVSLTVQYGVWTPPTVTLDMVPTVSVIEPQRNIFFGGGYSGSGIGPGFLFGKLLSKLHAGEPIDPVFEFALNRKPPWIPPEPFTSVGFALYKRYLHWQDKQ